MNMRAEPGRQFLRHALATLAYRGGKAVRGAPEAFGSFRAGDETRTPLSILAHIGDLLDWALSLAQSDHVWDEKPPSSWEAGVARFFDGLSRLDQYLASTSPMGCTPERLFQGPIADAFTHIGQISLLRRLAGAPIRGENYYQADIVSGRVAGTPKS
jgi:hypothetical protein